MRLITRSDFDGLACGALLRAAGVIDHWKFVHPKDLQDGLFEVNKDDCLANVPFVEGCGLWFDHHSSEDERQNLEGKYEGKSDFNAPSCARIIYDYYGGAEKFPGFDDIMEAVDKVDSGNLTIDEIQNPTGWILIGFLMDPRTGLGRFRNFTISNYELMERLLELVGKMPTAEILELPDVKERIAMYEEQTVKFKEMVLAKTQTFGNLLITDLRGEEVIYTGNRFMIYSMFPEQNISVWMTNGKGGEGIACAIGYSILNKTATLDVGHICLKYNGGGHKKVGTCQFKNYDDVCVMLEELKTLANQ
jgi:nanoRNase/pAp phosphatase (c-di-AMP/oligoRNAs hydrolase)